MKALRYIFSVAVISIAIAAAVSGYYALAFFLPIGLTIVLFQRAASGKSTVEIIDQEPTAGELIIAGQHGLAACKGRAAINHSPKRVQ